MKRSLLILGAIVVIGLIIWGAWLFIFSKNSPNSNTPSSLPSAVQSRSQSGATALVQNIASPQDPGVAKDFLGDIQNSDQIALGGTVIVFPYALQIWGDTNQGGEALLEYASSTGWALISLGGGEWSEFALLQEGVPVSTAEQLIAGLGIGTTSSSTSPVVVVPAGNTVTIGTPEGSVTTNNFYKSADYIAQDQQAVVVQQTSTFGIFYSVSDSSFVITVFGTPFETVRPMAETAFLTQLGISQADACKLKVVEIAGGAFNSPDGGKSFPLAFCSTSTSF
jgi:hypothetical protein